MRQKRLLERHSVELSPEIYHLASQEKLGALRKVYPVSKQETWIWMLGQIFIVWAVMAFILVAIPFATLLFPPGLSFAIFPLLVVAAVGFLLMIAGCYMSFSPKIYARWRVSLWDQGFIYEKQQICQTFRWDLIECVEQIVALVQKVVVHRCQMRRQDGYEVKLAAFSDLAELIDVVLEESALHMTPEELNIVPPKNTRIFTALKLDREGIESGQERLSWRAIQQVMIKNGTVMLLKKNE